MCDSQAHVKNKGNKNSRDDVTDVNSLVVNPISYRIFQTSSYLTKINYQSDIGLSDRS